MRDRLARRDFRDHFLLAQRDQKENKDFRAKKARPERPEPLVLKVNKASLARQDHPEEQPVHRDQSALKEM